MTLADEPPERHHGRAGLGMPGKRRLVTPDDENEFQVRQPVEDRRDLPPKVHGRRDEHADPADRHSLGDRFRAECREQRRVDAPGTQRAEGGAAAELEPASLVDAVRREVLEETARNFAPQGLVGVYRLPAAGRRPAFLRFTFWGSVSDVEPGRSLDAGILRADWHSLDEARSNASRHRSPLVMQCIDDYLAGLRFPLTLLRE